MTTDKTAKIKNAQQKLAKYYNNGLEYAIPQVSEYIDILQSNQDLERKRAYYSNHKKPTNPHHRKQLRKLAEQSRRERQQAQQLYWDTMIGNAEIEK